MTPRKQPPKADSLVREGATRVEIFNSGLEVWLYDEANTEEIRKKDVWRKLVGGEKTDGRLVGYSLWQDDELRVDVIVGKALTRKELAVARWLEPQTAFLRIPSGRLAIEANDSRRIGDDSEDRTDQGAVLDMPPGDYKLTLHRIDYETLSREGLEWGGAQEVIVLTPGGTKKDDFAGLLPFEEPHDTSWVGRIEVKGERATGLVWFDDTWDTYFANIDTGVASKLGLAPGRYLRTTVPAAGVEMITVFASSWTEGAKLHAPAGPKPKEFGYGAVIVPERWGAEAFFARRVLADKGIPEKHQTSWIEASFEVFDAEPATVSKRSSAGALFAGRTRSFHADTLAEKGYFDGQEMVLSMKLDEVVDGVSFDDTLTLAEAVEKLDASMDELGLSPLGDFSFELNRPTPAEPLEFTFRAWTGAKDHFAGVWASTESFEVFFFSRVGDRWVLTGTIDEDDAERVSEARPRISMRGTEEVALEDMQKLHVKHVKQVGGKADAIPAALADLAKLYDDYLDAAVGDA